MDKEIPDHSTDIPEEIQSLESAPPLITLSPFHQSQDNTWIDNILIKKLLQIKKTHT